MDQPQVKTWEDFLNTCSAEMRTVASEFPIGIHFHVKTKYLFEEDDNNVDGITSFFVVGYAINQSDERDVRVIMSLDNPRDRWTHKDSSIIIKGESLRKIGKCKDSEDPDDEFVKNLYLEHVSEHNKPHAIADFLPNS